MYDVTRKGYIRVFRVEPDGIGQKLVSSHVDEAEAINSAATHGERNGGGLYRLQYPDKMVKVIIQGPAPSPPVIDVAAVSGSSTELDITMVTAAVGVAPPFTYELEESANAGGSWATLAATFSGTPLRFRRGGLVAGNTRHYRLRALDSASPQRTSEWSNVGSATIPVIPGEPELFPNYPTVQILILQGSANEHLLDPTQHSKLADHEFYAAGGFRPTPTRCAQRVANMLLVRAQQDPTKIRTRFGLYTSVQQALKDFANDGNMRVNSDLINSPTEGNPNWWLRRVNGQQIEARFNPVTLWMINQARTSLRNSLNESYFQGLWRKWAELLDASDTAHNVAALLDFFFQDDVHFRMQQGMRVDSTPPNNLGPVVTDPDFEQNGVAENMTLFGPAANAGCRKWCEGIQDSIAAMKVRFPGRTWIGNSAECGTHYYDGDGTPPLPMVDHPMYGRVEGGLQEGVGPFGMGVTVNSSTGTTGYSYSGGGSLLHMSRLLAIHQLMLLPDALTEWGRAFVIVHANLVDRVPTQADYEYARLAFGLALLNERCALSLSIATDKPLSLNEALLELGDPLTARSMGTLNENTAGYTQRAADFSNGVARFYFMRSAKALTILRGDSPPVGQLWPTAGAEVSCTLPTPPAGQKYQFISENYENPRTGRLMRPQSPTINTGLDVGPTLSMRPYTVRVLRLVPI